jgi:purine-binding chemotaxis protein CheW
VTVTSSASDHNPGRRIAHEYLTFFVAGEEYALSLQQVREVIPYESVTRVPGVPSPIRGVTNVRGSVVPVVDLAIRFRLPEAPITARSCIVLVEPKIDGTPTLMGLVTEQIGQVLGLTEGELLAAPSFGAPIRAEFIAGMARVQKKFALVLELDRLLSPDELMLVDEPETSNAGDAEAADPEIASSADVDSGWEADEDSSDQPQKAPAAAPTGPGAQ